MRKKDKQRETLERKMLKKYPWFHYESHSRIKRKRILHPNNKWREPEIFSAYGDIPKGWNIAFGKLLLQDLDKEIKSSGVDFKVQDIKEKFGQLRFYFSGGNENIHRIIDAYSVLSENICMICGKPDVYMTNCGWYYPCCKECWDNHRPYEECICDDNKMANEYTVRKYTENGSQDIKYDISEYADRIRRKWEKHQRKELDRI